MLRPGGRIAFYSIFIPAGLTDRDHRRALRCGPPVVTTRGDYITLLRAAGYLKLKEVDVTAAYLDTARAWLREGHELAAELAQLEPPGAFADKIAHRREGIAAIEAGLLRRSLFIGNTPARQR